MPDIPEIPDTPEIPDIPELPDLPKIPDVNTEMLSNEVAGISAELDKSLKVITDSIMGIVGSASEGFSQDFMTPRQIAKKMLTLTAPEGLPYNEDDVHFIVYGKLTRDADGKLLDDEIQYPDCVNRDINIMSDNDPLLKDVIPKMLEETKNAGKNLTSKATELGTSVVTAIAEIVAGLVTFASNLTIMPFGSGVGGAISALLGILSTVKTLQTSLSEIPTLIEPLTNLTILLPDDKVESVMGPINDTLSTLSDVLEQISNLSLGGINNKIDELRAYVPPEDGTSGTSGDSGTSGNDFVNITPSPAVLDLTFNGYGTKVFTIDSSQGWTTSFNGSFFDFEPKMGASSQQQGASTITVTGLGTGPYETDQTGVLIIHSGEAQADIFVYQEAKPGGGGES